MSKNVFSVFYDLEEASALKNKLQRHGFQFLNIPYAFWQAKKEGLTITFYLSGKLLIQGWGADLWAQQHLVVTEKISGLEHVENLQSWIGTDEAGKGDLFGPLIVAAVYVHKSQLKELLVLEVQDSKSMSDKKIAEVAQKLKTSVTHEIMILEPESYNRLYNQFNNLNKLLAHAHTTVIDHLLQRVTCDVVISDKFGDELLIAEAISPKHPRLTLIQQPRAESNPAVAASSCLARNEFLIQLSRLSKIFECEFPKGASESAIQMGKRFIKKYGMAQLTKVAKLHFKTITALSDE